MRNRGGSSGCDQGDRNPKTDESNFIYHDFLQFGNQHLRCKAILSSIVLSHQCYEVHFMSHNSEAVIKLDYQILQKSSPDVTGWIRP